MHIAVISAHQHEPAGFIKLYSGPAVAIPMGWALCDGEGDTPNLRDNFVIGAGTSYNPDDTGGAASVSLAEANIPQHNHGEAGSHHHHVGTAVTYPGTTGVITVVGSTPLDTDTAGAHTHSNYGQATPTAVATLPPYYALAYIMKI